MQSDITIESLLLQDSELSSLPEIFIRVSELLDDENATAAQIGKVVETDPSLTTRILKMVNSAYYGFPHTIASINQAISILGRDRIRQILTGAVLGGIFGKMKNQVFFMEDYWYHSVKTAILSRLLGRGSRVADEAEVLFTAGLLHEIGLLILTQRVPDIGAQIRNLVDTEGGDIYQVEQQLLGFNHCDVGAAFISHWGLPEVLVQVTEFHNRPLEATDFVMEVRLVHLAKQLSRLVSPIDQQEVEFVLEDVPNWKDTGLGIAQIINACAEANDQVYEVMESLGMVAMRIDLDDED